MHRAKRETPGYEARQAILEPLGYLDLLAILETPGHLARLAFQVKSVEWVRPDRLLSLIHI